MVKSFKKRDGGFGKFILTLVFTVLLVVTFGYVYALKKEIDGLKADFKEIKESNTDVKQENNTNDECLCLDGKYYGELSNGLINMKQTYIFKKDGSYLTYVENGGGTGGYYKIVDGYIYFNQRPELGPSNDIYNYYFTLADDCKSIEAYYEEVTYTLNLVE